MAPLRAQIFHLFHTEKTKRKVSYWYGGRSKKELFYVDHFRKIEKEFPNFQFVIGLSEPLPEDKWIVKKSLDARETPPGFGHRFHTRDPRAARLFQMALELEVESDHVRMIRAVELVLHDFPDAEGRTLPVNIDGAIAAVCGDLGIPPNVANALFIISRVPGLAAHAREESERHAPMRQIDPKDHVYDGPSERRLPDRRSR